MEALVEGVANVLDLSVLFFVLVGVVVGSFFAAVPGLGGLVPISILLPWAITLQPLELIGVLFAIAGVANTANSFPSILIAVPGSVGSQATIVDGFPMARRGEAARAFGAAFAASAFGCVFGALVLIAAIPIIRPLVLTLGSPELFLLIVVALSAVGVLSTGAYAKGIAGALIGVLIASIGVDTKSAVVRFGFDTLYLWDGINLALLGLGLFAVPEVMALGMKRSSIAESQAIGRGLMHGVRDCFKHWFLMLRCSVIGSWIGFLPGIGGSVVDWVAYAHAVQSEKNPEGFGKGDVRGVIAPESANSSKEGGALIPTLGFGIPGSSANALLLVGLIAVGIAPGPQLLSSGVHIIFSIAAVLLISGLTASALSLGLSKQVAKVAFLPYGILVPTILGVSIVAAYATHFSVLDLVVLVLASALGFGMRRYGWPRPPLMLGAVLGSQAEQYLWLSVQRYDFAWLYRPGAIVLLALLVFVLFSPYLRRRRTAPGKPVALPSPAWSGVRINAAAIFAACMLAVLVYAVATALSYPYRAALMIVSAGGLGILLALWVLALELTGRGHRPAVAGAAGEPAARPAIFDYADDGATGVFAIWAWFALAFALAWVFGFLYGLPLFVLVYALLSGVSWPTAVFVTAIQWVVIYGVFGKLMNVPWPTPLLMQLI
jgi:TctA family transporter